MEKFLSCSIRWYCNIASPDLVISTHVMLTCYPTIFAYHHGAKLPENHTMVWGGWVSFAMTVIFSGFKSKPTRSNCLTNAPKRLPASIRECAKIKMPSAKRKSSNLGSPSIKLKPIFPTSALHSRIAHCNTTQNKRGLNTQPCRTPPAILNFLLCLMSPTTSPRCPKSTHCKIHTRWSGIPSSTRALHNAGQCTRSTAFDKSKLMVHTGIPIASVLSNIRLAVTSRRRWNPCCSSGCPASKKCSGRPSKRFAHVSYNKRMLAIGLKSTGCNGHVFSATC